MNPKWLICAVIALVCSTAASAAEVDTGHGTSTFDTPSSNRLIAGIEAIREHLNGRLPPSAGQGLVARRSTQLGLIDTTPGGNPQLRHVTHVQAAGSVVRNNAANLKSPRQSEGLLQV